MALRSPAELTKAQHPSSLLGFSKYCSILGRSQQLLPVIDRRTEDAHDLVAKLRRHGEWGRPGCPPWAHRQAVEEGTVDCRFKKWGCYAWQ